MVILKIKVVIARELFGRNKQAPKLIDFSFFVGFTAFRLTGINFTEIVSKIGLK